MKNKYTYFGKIRSTNSSLDAVITMPFIPKYYKVVHSQLIQSYPNPMPITGDVDINYALTSTFASNSNNLIIAFLSKDVFKGELQNLNANSNKINCSFGIIDLDDYQTITLEKDTTDDGGGDDERTVENVIFAIEFSD